jgi:ERCC4-related helicase
LASSTFALRRSLENRARRLDEALKHAQDVIKLLPTDFAIPDADEMEEMEDVDRERLEDQLAAVSIARNAEQVREEIEELKVFAKRAAVVEEGSEEAKRRKLEELLKAEGFFADPAKRLLIFTEFKDTLTYIMGRLRGWGFKVGCIHGSMKTGSREEEGTAACIFNRQNPYSTGIVNVTARR